MDTKTINNMSTYVKYIWTRSSGIPDGVGIRSTAFLCTSNHLSISNRRPLRFDTAIGDRFFRLQERLNAAIWRYMGVCTGWLVVLLRTYSYTSLLVSLVGRTIYFGCQLYHVGLPLVSAVCPPVRRIYVAPYRSLRPGRPGLLWVPGSILERP